MPSNESYISSHPGSVLESPVRSRQRLGTPPDEENPVLPGRLRPQPIDEFAQPDEVGDVHVCESDSPDVQHRQSALADVAPAPRHPLAVHEGNPIVPEVVDDVVAIPGHVVRHREHPSRRLRGPTHVAQHHHPRVVQRGVVPVGHEPVVERAPYAVSSHPLEVLEYNVRPRTREEPRAGPIPHPHMRRGREVVVVVLVDHGVHFHGRSPRSVAVVVEPVPPIVHGCAVAGKAEPPLVTAHDRPVEHVVLVVAVVVGLRRPRLPPEGRRGESAVYRGRDGIVGGNADRLIVERGGREVGIDGNGGCKEEEEEEEEEEQERAGGEGAGR